MNGMAKSASWLMICFIAISQSVFGAETVSEPDRKVLNEACQTLKVNAKRTSCLDVVNRLGQTKLKVAPAKVVQPAYEPITLKGVPFDTPGSSEAIMNLCLTTGWNHNTPEMLQKDDMWCKFDKNGRISMPGFEYGNLAELARVNVDSEGALISFESEAPKGEMLELASMLSEKYGNPQVMDSQTENKMGTKFDKKTFLWVDKLGTRIVIDSIFRKIDSGRIVIESASMVKRIEVIEKIQKESKKGKL